MKSYRELVNILESISSNDDPAAIDNLEDNLQAWAEHLEQQLHKQAQTELPVAVDSFGGNTAKLAAALEAIKEKHRGTIVAIICDAINNVLETQ